MSKKKLNIDDVIKILTDLVETFIDDEEMLYAKLLMKQGIRSSNIPYWINKDERVKELIDELKEQQELKIYSALLNPSSKNVTGLIFYAKAKLKAIEYEKELQHEIELRKIENINNVSDFTLSVNYNTIPSRSDDDITALLNGEEDASE